MVNPKSYDNLNKNNIPFNAYENEINFPWVIHIFLLLLSLLSLVS